MHLTAFLDGKFLSTADKDLFTWLNPLLRAFKIYHALENILENGTFALLEQMLHFP